jgi:putative transposase
MGHSLASIHLHLIFSTKDRRPLLRAEWRPDAHAYLGGIVRELGGTAIIVNGTDDHVHLLVEMPAKLSLSEMMRVIKANSSKWINGKHASGFAWQTGYAAFSVSRSQVPEVVRYIRNQEQHHRKMSFQEELVAFLKKHGISYDEKYIWS